MAAVGVAVRRFRVATALIPTDPGVFRAAVRSGNGDTIAAAMRCLVPDEDDRAVLLAGLVEGSAPQAAVATLNEHLGDVAHALAASATGPRSMARAALASGTLAALLELGASVSSPSGAAWGPALWEFVAGAVGAAATVEIDRRAAARADQARVGWDVVAAAFATRLEPEGGASPSRDRGRGRRSRG